MPTQPIILATITGTLLTALIGHPAVRPHSAPTAVSATLSEWKVELSRATVESGQVAFNITNTGSIPHAFEVEGQGMEKETGIIQPGARATLTLTLRPGQYEVYCPVGDDSHKMLGMLTHLSVGASTTTNAAAATRIVESGASSDAMPSGGASKARSIRVTGGGPVIQILPGPFPFPDSVAPVLPQFGAERASLESQAKSGPYSNNVARIGGAFDLTAWDRGAVRDSVSGAAEFTTRDGARWRLVMDRVQTTDVPHHPRFGGVILGLYYHGDTGVHTPLVPTIKSAVALWAFGHLYRNGTLVTDSAMVHVMLLSRTRRASDFALDCWNCSKNPIDELQLQVTPAPGAPQFDAPGGFLFVNWETSRGEMDPT